MTRRETYTVRPRSDGGWEVVNGNGTCLLRRSTKRDAVSAGAQRARNRTKDSTFRAAAPSRLVVKLADGRRIDEERFYS